jgi:hypothetical protein
MPSAVRATSAQQCVRIAGAGRQHEALGGDGCWSAPDTAQGRQVSSPVADPKCTSWGTEPLASAPDQREHHRSLQHHEEVIKVVILEQFGILSQHLLTHMQSLMVDVHVQQKVLLERQEALVQTLTVASERQEALASGRFRQDRGVIEERSTNVHFSDSIEASIEPSSFDGLSSSDAFAATDAGQVALVLDGEDVDSGAQAVVVGAAMTADSEATSPPVGEGQSPPKAKRHRSLLTRVLARGQDPGPLLPDDDDDDDSAHARKTSKPRNTYNPATSSAVCRRSGVDGDVFDLRAKFDCSPIDVQIYDVSKFYYRSGCAQAIARSEFFGNLTLAMIALNAVYIGVDADNNKSDSLFASLWGYQVCEQIFCTFFVFEWSMRFLAFRKKKDCLKDMWFKFDTCLVFLMVFEVWFVQFVVLILGGEGGVDVPTGPLKLLRLLRLARVSRMVRCLPELVTMIKAIVAASRAVCTSMVLQLGLVYVFAIIIHMYMKDADVTNAARDFAAFATLPDTMWTLIADGVYMDNTSRLLREVWDKGYWYIVLVFFIFVLLSATTVMNMLIGVLVEVVAAVAASEREESAIAALKDTILVLLRKIDLDGSGFIHKGELDKALDDPDVMQVIGELQINFAHFLDVMEMMYDGGQEVSIKTIMEAFIAHRGDRPAMVKDFSNEIIFLRWTLRRYFKEQALVFQRIALDPTTTDLDFQLSLQENLFMI